MSDHADALASQLAQFHLQIANKENWQPNELDDLLRAVSLLADATHGMFSKMVGEVVIERAEMGTKFGLAYRNKIQLRAGKPISMWAALHELAHVWDAQQNWALSVRLEEFTGGFTDAEKSAALKHTADWDAGMEGALPQPGMRGRKPGVNKAGYFYGDKPAGSDWNFNRKEDFAESVVMYCGWGRANALSRAAHGRIERYLLPNGAKDPLHGVAENWSDYAAYFYPHNGEYQHTKRWRFVDRLVKGDGN